MENPVDRAAATFGGNQAELARQLSVSPQAISKWRRNGIPADRVLDVERVSGVHRHFLNPAIYPDRPTEAA